MSSLLSAHSGRGCGESKLAAGRRRLAKRMVRGQEGSLDLIAAMAIFMVVLLSLTSTWLTSTSKLAEAEERQKLGDRALTIAEQLVAMEGNPSDWHNRTNLSGVDEIGLADGRKRLNWEKVAAFGQLAQNNMSELKEVLGIGSYSISVAIEWPNGTAITSVGDEFNENDEASVFFRVQRMALLNGSIKMVRVGLWR